MAPRLSHCWGRLCSSPRCSASDPLSFLNCRHLGSEPPAGTSLSICLVVSCCLCLSHDTKVNRFCEKVPRGIHRFRDEAAKARSGPSVDPLGPYCQLGWTPRLLQPRILAGVFAVFFFFVCLFFVICFHQHSHRKWLMKPDWLGRLGVAQGCILTGPQTQAERAAGVGGVNSARRRNLLVATVGSSWEAAGFSEPQSRMPGVKPRESPVQVW